MPRSERLRWPSRSTVGLVVGPLLAAVVAWAVPDMTPAATDAPRYAGALTAATLVLMGVWWMTEALPLAVTALLPLVVLPVAGVAPMSDVAEPYANKVIFLFLGGFVLAIALQRWDVHLRIALGVVRLVGTAPRRLVLGMMTATALVSMWVSNTATAVMMLPIGVSVLAMLGRGRGGVDPRLSSALMLGIAYAATIGSFGTIIASPPRKIQRLFVWKLLPQSTSVWLSKKTPRATRTGPSAKTGKNLAQNVAPIMADSAAAKFEIIASGGDRMRLTHT